MALSAIQPVNHRPAPRHRSARSASLASRSIHHFRRSIETRTQIKWCDAPSGTIILGKMGECINCPTRMLLWWWGHMAENAEFLADRMPRPWSTDAKHGFQSVGLFIGNEANAIEVAVAQSPGAPTRTALLESWKARRGGRAAPVLLIVLHPGGAALCGASGEQPPVYPTIDAGQAERLCREALDQPDRHAALRFLAQALPSLETALPGLNNEGLVALHERQFGTPERQDWGEARRKAAGAPGKRDVDLPGALGVRVERIDNLTSLLRSGDRRTALAVMLHESESHEAGGPP